MWKVFLVNKHLKPAALLENMKEFYTPSVYDLEVILAACMVLAKDVVLQMRVRFGRLCPCCVRCWPPIARVGHQRINYCSASFHSPSNHRGLLDWRDKKKKCSPAGSNPHQRASARRTTLASQPFISFLYWMYSLSYLISVDRENLPTIITPWYAQLCPKRLLFRIRREYIHIPSNMDLEIGTEHNTRRFWMGGMESHWRKANLSPPLGYAK